jgi:hypothetical protein
MVAIAVATVTVKEDNAFVIKDILWTREVANLMEVAIVVAMVTVNKGTAFANRDTIIPNHKVVLNNLNFI